MQSLTRIERASAGPHSIFVSYPNILHHLCSQIPDFNITVGTALPVNMLDIDMRKRFIIEDTLH